MNSDRSKLPITARHEFKDFFPESSISHTTTALAQTMAARKENSSYQRFIEEQRQQRFISQNKASIHLDVTREMLEFPVNINTIAALQTSSPSEESIKAAITEDLRAAGFSDEIITTLIDNHYQYNTYAYQIFDAAIKNAGTQYMASDKNLQTISYIYQENGQTYISVTLWGMGITDTVDEDLVTKIIPGKLNFKFQLSGQAMQLAEITSSNDLLNKLISGENIADLNQEILSATKQEQSFAVTQVNYLRSSPNLQYAAELTQLKLALENEEATTENIESKQQRLLDAYAVIEAISSTPDYAPSQQRLFRRIEKRHILKNREYYHEKGFHPPINTTKNAIELLCQTNMTEAAVYTQMIDDNLPVVAMMLLYKNLFSQPNEARKLSHDHHAGYTKIANDFYAIADNKNLSLISKYSQLCEYINRHSETKEWVQEIFTTHKASIKAKYVNESTRTKISDEIRKFCFQREEATEEAIENKAWEELALNEALTDVVSVKERELKLETAPTSYLDLFEAAIHLQTARLLMQNKADPRDSQRGEQGTRVFEFTQLKTDEKGNVFITSAVDSKIFRDTLEKLVLSNPESNQAIFEVLYNSPYAARESAEKCVHYDTTYIANYLISIVNLFEKDLPQLLNIAEATAKRGSVPWNASAREKCIEHFFSLYTLEINTLLSKFFDKNFKGNQEYKNAAMIFLNGATSALEKFPQEHSQNSENFNNQEIAQDFANHMRRKVSLFISPALPSTANREKLSEVEIKTSCVTEALEQAYGVQTGMSTAYSSISTRDLGKLLPKYKQTLAVPETPEDKKAAFIQAVINFAIEKPIELSKELVQIVFKRYQEAFQQNMSLSEALLTGAAKSKDHKSQLLNAATKIVLKNREFYYKFFPKYFYIAQNNPTGFEQVKVNFEDVAEILLSSQEADQYTKMINRQLSTATCLFQYKDFFNSPEFLDTIPESSKEKYTKELFGFGNEEVDLPQGIEQSRSLHISSDELSRLTSSQEDYYSSGADNQQDQQQALLDAANTHSLKFKHAIQEQATAFYAGISTRDNPVSQLSNACEFLEAHPMLAEVAVEAYKNKKAEFEEKTDNQAVEQARENNKPSKEAIQLLCARTTSTGDISRIVNDAHIDNLLTPLKVDELFLSLEQELKAPNKNAETIILQRVQSLLTTALTHLNKIIQLGDLAEIFKQLTRDEGETDAKIFLQLTPIFIYKAFENLGAVGNSSHNKLLSIVYSEIMTRISNYYFPTVIDRVSDKPHNEKTNKSLTNIAIDIINSDFSNLLSTEKEKSDKVYKENLRYQEEGTNSSPFREEKTVLDQYLREMSSSGKTPEMLSTLFSYNFSLGTIKEAIDDPRLCISSELQEEYNEKILTKFSKQISSKDMLELAKISSQVIYHFSLQQQTIGRENILALRNKINDFIQAENDNYNKETITRFYLTSVLAEEIKDYFIFHKRDINSSRYWNNITQEEVNMLAALRIIERIANKSPEEVSDKNIKAALNKIKALNIEIPRAITDFIGNDISESIPDDLVDSWQETQEEKILKAASDNNHKKLLRLAAEENPITLLDTDPKTVLQVSKITDKQVLKYIQEKIEELPRETNAKQVFQAIIANPSYSIRAKIRLIGSIADHKVYSKKFGKITRDNIFGRLSPNRSKEDQQLYIDLYRFSELSQSSADDNDDNLIILFTHFVKQREKHNQHVIDGFNNTVTTADALISVQALKNKANWIAYQEASKNKQRIALTEGAPIQNQPITELLKEKLYDEKTWPNVADTKLFAEHIVDRFKLLIDLSGELKITDFENLGELKIFPDNIEPGETPEIYFQRISHYVLNALYKEKPDVSTLQKEREADFIAEVVAKKLSPNSEQDKILLVEKFQALRDMPVHCAEIEDFILIRSDAATAALASINNRPSEVIAKVIASIGTKLTNSELTKNLEHLKVPNTAFDAARYNFYIECAVKAVAEKGIEALIENTTIVNQYDTPKAYVEFLAKQTDFTNLLISDAYGTYAETPDLRSSFVETFINTHKNDLPKLLALHNTISNQHHDIHTDEKTGYLNQINAALNTHRQKFEALAEELNQFRRKNEFRSNSSCFFSAPKPPESMKRIVDYIQENNQVEERAHSVKDIIDEIRSIRQTRNEPSFTTKYSGGRKQDAIDAYEILDRFMKKLESADSKNANLDKLNADIGKIIRPE